MPKGHAALGELKRTTTLPYTRRMSPMTMPAAPAWVIFFAIFVALWPVAGLAAAIHHSFARQWRRLAQVALLLPMWMLAVSIGLVSMGSYLNHADAVGPAPGQLSAGVGVAFAACLVVAAWWLLLRSSFRRPPPAR
jgi:hypothetical protein